MQAHEEKMTYEFYEISDITNLRVDSNSFCECDKDNCLKTDAYNKLINCRNHVVQQRESIHESLKMKPKKWWAVEETIAFILEIEDKSDTTTINLILIKDG